MKKVGELESLASSIHEIASPFRSYLSDLHEELKEIQDGKVTNYTPELIPIEPDCFGISIITTEGEEFEVGDTNQSFTLQSLVNLLVYGLALEDYGREYVANRIRVEPTGNHLYQLELAEGSHFPKNPLSVAGAIAIADLIKGNSLSERLQRVLNLLSRYTGRTPEVDSSVFQAQKSAGNYERGLACWLRECGALSDHLQDTLKLYFQIQAILVNSNDVAMIAATLANGGVNPLTGQAAIEKAYVQDLLSLMATCGLGKDSSEWLYRVGMPTQSSAGGGTLSVITNQLGIGVFSPLINQMNHSVRGLKVVQTLGKKFGLHLFNAATPSQTIQAFMTQHEAEDW
jgi:glutaminase